jgi:hypothetical protein
MVAEQVHTADLEPVEGTPVADRQLSNVPAMAG